ncbi:hypothetical protein MSPP1_001203 [Malassezia sp. CBS 17886]|nr:hypothetical protein MSPP1_001203 [Malassezia sp. CBS 17886]
MYDKRTADYSVYLVTGRELLPEGMGYLESLEASLRDGNVSMVQIREKKASYKEFVDIARTSLAVCDKVCTVCIHAEAQYGVTMVINDNVAVAAELPERVGVHLGQDDAQLQYARERLGQNRLLGISVHTVDEAHAALGSPADYAGVGPCWPTLSKEGIAKEDVLMLQGAREVVAALADTRGARRLPAVLIGGINANTAMRTLCGAQSATNAPDGIAVISAVVAQRDPGRAAATLRAIVRSFQEHGGRALEWQPAPPVLPAQLVDEVVALLAEKEHAASTDHSRVLVQSITSHVSSNFSANVALAFSVSPIMSSEAEEADALSHAIQALLLNIGTITADARRGMGRAGPAANAAGVPVVLDPVGVGATPFRYETANDILNHTQVTLLKGNAAELATLVQSTDVRAQGVDSVGELAAPAALVRELARQEGCLVLLTGEVDYLTDGNTIITSRCGSPLLGRVTATGCALGVLVAAGIAFAMRKNHTQLARGSTLRSAPPRMHRKLLVGALAGLLVYTIAAERAASLPSVHGPGTFVPALLDAISAFRAADAAAYVGRVGVQEAPP